MFLESVNKTKFYNFYFSLKNQDGILRFIVDLKKEKGNSEWTRFPGIKIVDGELYYRGFTVRKISKIQDRRGGKETMKNIKGMIPKKRTKYNGAVLENLNSQIFGTSIKSNNIMDKEQVSLNFKIFFLL